MSWSFSQQNVFRSCQRQWFFKYKYANTKSNDPLRNEARRLGRLVSLKAWRGKIVDSVISDYIIPAIGQEKPADLESSLQKAGSIFQRQQLLGLQKIEDDNTKFYGFLEVEYGNIPQPEAFDEAWDDINSALKTFFSNSFIFGALNEAIILKAQKTLSFKSFGVSVFAIPDVICFYQDKAPLIIDWKVHSNPIGNYWKQLGLYSLALTSCNPHRDWPRLPDGLKPSDISLVEMQLLTNTVRIHTVTMDEIEDLEELIATSSNEMALALGGNLTKLLRPVDFPSSDYSGVCEFCSFKRLCW
jgi:hypothetical protein